MPGLFQPGGLFGPPAPRTDVWGTPMRTDEDSVDVQSAPGPQLSWWDQLWGKKPKKIETYSTPYYAPPKFDEATAAAADLAKIDEEIKALSDSLSNAPKWVSEDRPQYTTTVQSNIDALEEYKAQVEAFLATTTTPPPTEMDILGDSPELMRLYREAGSIASNTVGGGVI